MKSGNKIALFYTGFTIAILLVIALVVFFIAALFMHQVADEGTPLWPYPLLYLGLILLGLVLLGSFVAYLVGKRYATRMSDWVEAAYQSEKTFIGNASHELNNPLTAIQGECDIILLKERTPTEYQMALQRIVSETRRIIQLMKHLLFLSHGDKEILQTAVEPILLADFLMQFVQNRVTFSPDSFGFVVSANPNLLKMAIGNIINNALKYSSEDLPVRMRLISNVLEIRDAGIGIPADELEQIAQPFFRASNTREHAGHGVGLSLSIRILNTYGAKVTITSEVNKGTCIVIDFP